MSRSNSVPVRLARAGRLEEARDAVSPRVLSKPLEPASWRLAAAVERAAGSPARAKAYAEVASWFG